MNVSNDYILKPFAAYNLCKLCPRECGVNRAAGQRGRCHMDAEPVVNLSMLHFGEEPVISGVRGSGAVFFEGCALGCPFCQNYNVSRGVTGAGRAMDAESLASLFISLQSQGAHNINLVTGMHFAPSIIEAVKLARARGLVIPIVANCGGYESVSTLRMLEGIVDVYLPDFKFWDSKLSTELIGASDYRERACEAIEEMVRQTGPAVIGEDGLMKRGVIVRHLMMPGKLFDTKKILDHLVLTYGDDIYISLMNQYTPMPQLDTLPNLPSYLYKKLSPSHYETACDYAALLGQTKLFVQGDDASGDEMIPDFKA